MAYLSTHSAPRRASARSFRKCSCRAARGCSHARAASSRCCQHGARAAQKCFLCTANSFAIQQLCGSHGSHPLQRSHPDSRRRTLLQAYGCNQLHGRGRRRMCSWHFDRRLLMSTAWVKGWMVTHTPQKQQRLQPQGGRCRQLTCIQADRFKDITPADSLQGYCKESITHSLSALPPSQLQHPMSISDSALLTRQKMRAMNV